MTVTFVIVSAVIAFLAYTFGVLVGIKFASISTQSIQQGEQISSQEQLTRTNEDMGPPRVYTYAIDQAGSVYNSTQIPYDNEVIRNTITSVVGQYVINSIAERLIITQDPQAVFENTDKLSGYINSPYVSLTQLKYLLNLLDKVELFRWSQLVLQRINQLENGG